MSLIRNGCDWGLEVNFFGIDGWEADANFPNTALPSGVGILAVDKAIPLPVSAVGFEERSKLYNGEVNLRRPIKPWLTVLAGFRWVELEDAYFAQGTEAILSTPFSEAIRAHNHLYGSQIGVDVVLLKEQERFQIHGIAKTGLFYNAASQNSTFSNPGGALGPYSADASGSHASFLGEVGLMASQRINEHAVLRFGYEAMWIDGVALGPRQIPSTDLGAGTADIETGGGVFFHGANLGLEFTW